MKVKSKDGKTIEYKNGPMFSSFYCNNVAYATNALDFILILGEILDVDESTVTVEQRARVTMAPAQARVLRGLLDFQIKQYEARLGHPIELPAGISEEFAAMAPKNEG
jgi:hypothetical protein